MTTIFYLSTIIFLILELRWIIAPIDKTNDAKAFMELSKEFKGKEWNEYSDEYKTHVKSKIWLVWVLFWMLIGLFTVQWVGFLFIIVFNFIIIAPLSKLTKYSMTYSVIHWFNSLIGFCFGVFVIVNHYHLHIDLTQWFLSLFK